MEVRVHNRQGKMQHQVQIGQHCFSTDVAAELGGEDKGADPHDLLAASLAACTALTVTLYAKRKQWDLQDIDVRVAHEQQGDSYVFHRKISYIGNLNSEEKQRLTEIAGKCPVHKILVGQVKIDTEMV